MASRPQGYGLSRELALKTAGKYSDSDEVSVTPHDFWQELAIQSEIIAWFQTLGISNGPADRGMDGFQEWLKSGHILCALMNQLAPGSIRKINNTDNVKMAVSLLVHETSVNQVYLSRRYEWTKSTKTFPSSCRLVPTMALTKMIYSR